MYIGAILLLNHPYIQQNLSVFVSNQLSQLLGSRVSIGKIDIGMLNHVIIEELELNDRSGKELLQAARLSAKFDIFPLLSGDVSISNIQLFGFNINMEKDTPDSQPNFQFIIDTFVPKKSSPNKTAPSLRINSLLIRRGRLSYHVHSEPETPGKFNPNHVQLNNIIASLSIKALQTDSVNASVKRMSMLDEISGFELNKLGLHLVGNEKDMKITDFEIDLPGTSIKTDTILVHYNGLDAFRNIMHDVQFVFHLQPSRITMKDFSAFLPAFKHFNEPILCEINAGGSMDNLECTKLSLSSGNNFVLEGKASISTLPDTNNMHILGRLSKLYTNREGTSFIFRNMNGTDKKIPQVLLNLGKTFFQGEISGNFNNLATHGKLETELGSIYTDLKIKADNQEKVLSYIGNVRTEDFELGMMLGKENMGMVSFNLDIDGKNDSGKYPAISLKGLVSSFHYNNYTYSNMIMDGEYVDGGFVGKVLLDDKNGTVAINGSINTASPVPVFNFQMDVAHVRPHELHLTKSYEGAEFNVKVKADFTGNSIDEMKGEINIDSLLFIDGEKQFFMQNLKMAAIPTGETRKKLSITSDFMTGEIEGDYSYPTLPASMLNIVNRYIPALKNNGLDSKEVETRNNFGFDFTIYDAEILSTVFDIPLKLYTRMLLKGYIDDKAGKIRIESYFPRVRYKNKFIESGMLLCENPEDRLHARIRFTNRKSNNNAINLSLDAQARNDSVQTSLSWGNSAETTYSGKIEAMATILHEQMVDEKSDSLPQPATLRKGNLNIGINIYPTDVILNDTVWKIHPSYIEYTDGRVCIDNFNFSHNERHLHINGILSSSSQDTVRIDLKRINIGYIFDIANLGVNFTGEATGPAFASGVMDKPVMSTDLYISDFGLNEGILGNADIHGEWHNEVKGIYLDADIHEKDIARTRVYGYIYPIKPTSSLDLQIEAESTNLKFIHHYMRGITSQFDGRVSGDIHFYGRFKALTLEGRVAGEASMKMDILNTTYLIKDSILIHPEGLTFKNNRIYDTQGNSGVLSGFLHYQHFRNLQYRFDFNVNNMLVMNTRESPDFPFYGVVYGTGNATIAGSAQTGVNIDVAMTTNRNTDFTYIKDNVSSAVSNQFIKFVDKTPRRTVHDSIFLSDFEIAWQEVEKEEEEITADIHMNLLIDATPEATMRIIMDPMAGDYISGKGTGNIRAEYFNKGDMRMFGNYTIEQGIYKFSLQEVFRKDFLIEEGSTIAFNGSPYDAILDIRAIYTVPSASLNDLIPDASTYVEQTNVKVNCIMELSGQLTSPDIKLNLELPNERDEVQALVRNYVATDEQMNMQILYLLGIGKFYAQENTGNSQSSDMMSSMLSSTLSGQLNNALSNVIDNKSWNFGTNLSTGENGWTDMEIEGMLYGQLLNNRLIIDGNFGYRDNPAANTNFVGDFKAEWLITKEGDIRLKAFNETNDRYYTRSNLTTQGIGIIFKRDFNKWNELFFWNKWRLKRLRKKGIVQEKDSLQTSHATQ